VRQHSIKSFSAALFKKPFYLAFVNIFIYFKSPVKILIRYIFEVGDYPKNIYVRTPLALQCVTAFSHHDLITIIECFGKLDYKAPKNCSVVVDFGSNIGISALYFLTRNEGVRVHLFEPVPRNIERLKQNLKGFEERYELRELAVGIEEGQSDFSCEDTGRYGSLITSETLASSQFGSRKVIKVNVVSANKLLEEILAKHKSVDIVKIDIEGYENKILSHLKTKVLSRIGRIYAETLDGQKIPGFLSKSSNGLTKYYRT